MSAGGSEVSIRSVYFRCFDVIDLLRYLCLLKPVVEAIRLSRKWQFFFVSIQNMELKL